MKARLAMVCALQFAFGCAHAELNRAEDPGGTPITDLPVEQVPVMGLETWAWVGAAEDKHVGELVAVDADYLWLLEEHGVLRCLPVREVRRAEVELHPSRAGYAGLWTAVGTLSTASHGILLVFTAPIWLSAGLAGTASLATGNDVVARPLDLPRLDAFARFPQGIPDRLRTCPRIQLTPASPADGLPSML